MSHVEEERPRLETEHESLSRELHDQRGIKFSLILLSLFLITSTRLVFDAIWFFFLNRPASWILFLSNDLIYLFLLYLGELYLAVVFLKRFWNVNITPIQHDRLYSYSIFIWLTYPLVPLLSVIAKEPPLQTIEWFKYFPFFMIYENYFAIGMTAIIPVLLLGYSFLLAKYSTAKWYQAFLAVGLGNLILYLLFYQYLYRFAMWLFHQGGNTLYVLDGYCNIEYLIFVWKFSAPFFKTYNSTSLTSRFYVPFGLVSFLMLLYGLFSTADKTNVGHRTTLLLLALLVLGLLAVVLFLPEWLRHRRKVNERAG